MNLRSKISGRSIGSTSADHLFAREMLPAVSRTFAPAIKILPEPLADSIRLAYLLCRVADTVEDATRLPSKTRQAFLMRYASLLSAEPGTQDPAPFAQEVACALDGDTAEIHLVVNLPRLLALLALLDSGKRESIVRWTRELSLGMARFVGLEPASSNGWTALQTCEELADYEYYVAGTVGCMLNDLIHLHVAGSTEDVDGTTRQLAISFGLGLQGTNIIQDLSDDRERGWSYLPEEIAQRHGTTTADLHRHTERAAAMAAVHEMAQRALGNLDDGLEYVLRLPRRQPRIRLFCVWPLLLAIRTLGRLVGSPTVLVRRVRISRQEVRELTRESLMRCLSNAALRRLYQRERATLVAKAGWSEPKDGGRADEDKNQPKENR